MRPLANALLGFWRALPVFVRAPILAFVVLDIGSTCAAVPLFVNTKVFTEIPWSLPLTLLLMWLFWLYAIGRGPPAGTREYRARMTRDKRLAPPVWRAALLAIMVCLIATWSLRLILPSIAPVDPPHLAVDVRSFPVATVIALTLALAISAGIAEEVAFRGYLQKSLEEAYGIVPALLLTGVAFWFAHADKVTLSHLPFHLAVSILLGTVTYLTRSLLPAIIGHTLGDGVLLPAYVYQRPAALWALLSARPVFEGHPTDSLTAILSAFRPALLLEPGAHPLAVAGWILIVSAIAAVLALRHLARVAGIAGSR
jgi:membrane protease YdiL (CAAX protease family)